MNAAGIPGRMRLIRAGGLPWALLVAMMALADPVGAAESSFVVELSERPGPRGSWSIVPTELRGPNPGDNVTLIVRNTGNTVHNLTIEGHPEGSVEALLSPGDERTVTFSVPKVGRFAYWCDVPGHREQGMEGRLIVGRFPTGPSAASGPGEALVLASLGLVALLLARAHRLR